MRNIWLVIKHEVVTTLKRPSFWIMTFLMPALLLGLQIYTVIQDSDLDLGSADAGKTEETSSTEMPVIGLVDEAGLIVEIPADGSTELAEVFPPNLFRPYADEATARAALEADEIEQYVHIPADYIASGAVTVYDKNFQILASGESMGAAFHSANEWMLAYLINLNLTGDPQLVSALRNPIPGAYAERHVVNPPVETDESVRALGEIIARVMPYMFYFILLVGSGYLLRSVADEKENRTVEVLLLSLHPRQLMMGKILGLSVVTLVQLGIWLGGGMLILNRGSALLDVSGFAFPPGFVVWAFLFLALGFLLFASVMAAAGAIAPTAREGGQVTWLLMLPLMPTLMFGQLFVEEPNSPLVLGLSLFPFSAPSAMVTRLALAEVPLWQIIVSLAGLALTTYLMVVLAARFFRAGNLLSDASFSLRRLATEWRE